MMTPLMRSHQWGILVPSRLSSKEKFLILCWCGAMSGHGRVSPNTYLVTSLALDFVFYTKRVTFSFVPIVASV